MRVGCATSPGQVRSTNEDSVLCEPVDAPSVRRRGLFCVVADGMGGHAAGDVASALAVRKARDVYYAARVASAEEALRQAIEAANDEVFAAGAGTSGRDQMGSTITAVAVHDGRAFVGHVGDSRCYLIRDGEIRQLTRDHSWVAEEVRAGVLTEEEARHHPRRNIITRALGLQARVEVDLVEAPVELRSALLLCSDGLHGVVGDEEILAYADRFPPQQAVDELVALANTRGGPDNITVVLVEIGSNPPSHPSSERETLRGQPRQPGEPTQPAPLAQPQDHTDASPPRPTAVLPVSGGTPRTPLADSRPEPAIPRPSNRGKGMLIGILIGLAVMAAGIGWLVWSPPTRSTPPPELPVPTPPPATASPSARGGWDGRGPPRDIVDQMPRVLALRRAPEPRIGEPNEENEALLVLLDDAAVRVAPVLGAPIVGWLERDESIAPEAAVYGEEADGSARWYLVTHPRAPEPARGFIHSSLARQGP
ncbi:MAG: Stp1/IreP family PP2C-type Ser/Thr phosphatase [Chloroflexi bacterium]|nr:Stp1/IreP family PP2C-type Ser/Thr phosphatase [Chloroflexota bacterium]